MEKLHTDISYRLSPFFQNKWDGGSLNAGEAFKAAKQILIDEYKKYIKSIESLKWERFKSVCCSGDIEKEDFKL